MATPRGTSTQITLFDSGHFGCARVSTSRAQTYSGWFLGSGYEYAISFLPGLFWKTEYRFSPITAPAEQSDHHDCNGLPVFGFDIYVNSQKYVQTIRSELVWRFGWRYASLDPLT